ncbi:D-alanyl-D-alanine carboxypeptidase [Streptomyces sp. NBC_01363]|uniref:D-alanyl-D-alanine carboxypeptidase n=1 Tax=Streptomyces sp. NBC_01363 TaxID=2903840 RepID=UPI0022575F92|nr:D-alanyl-D-alanine carboxypeptidase [Streptomyces sp. NBC_01363]MCX4731485.1 D-alanyl-D-alanine carboxypeptidase [Streptomyces sp. NBC_01363]
MAGESPDKSEQQKSSGTARSESDPRLAVFREPPADDAAAGKTDTATAVFRTAPVTEDGEGAEGATADTATAVFCAMPSEDGERGEGAEGVDDPEPEGTESEGSGAEEPSAEADGDTVADSEVEAEGPDGAVGAEEAEKTEGAAKDSEDPEKAPEASESADAGEPADAAADEEAAAKPAEGSGEGSEEGDARLRAAVAAWVTKDDDADGDDDAQGDDAKAATPKDEDAEDADTDAAADAATASSDADADADVEDGDGDEPSDGASDDSDDKAPSAEEKKAEAGKKAEAEADDAAAEDKQGIDQPTAIFRAPAALRVDQPTTALKITPPGAKTAKPGSEAESEAESAAERTSKFVPLRGDDVRPAPAPAPRKPEVPAASAAKPGTPPPTALSGAERTTQQPMPPRPPLDLLAELTNTPPPPETSVRTAVRRVKIWTPLVLLLVIVFAIVQMVRPLPDPELQMSAKDTYTFKGSKPSLPWPDEGQGYMAATGLGPVGSFGEQKAVPIGSVAKAMTAYIVLKDHPLKKGEEGPSIDIDATAEKEGGYDAVNESTLNTVKEGDKLTLKQALSAIMIPSANNIARLLARWDAGSEEAFVKKMNDTAKSLGMKNTTYTDPSGLNATTVSSAEDQVKLGEKLVEIPALMAITVLPSWTDPSGHEWPNWNKLVPFNGSLGIKTGSTTKAGGNLLFAAHKMVGKTDQLIVGAVLGQHKVSIIDTVNAVSKDVMIATQDLLKDAKVIKKGDVVGTVSDGLGGSVPVVATKDVSAVGWAGLTVKIELTDDGKTIPHSAAAGTHVGTLTVGEGTSQVKVPVALQSDLAEPSFGDKLTRIG